MAAEMKTYVHVLEAVRNGKVEELKKLLSDGVDYVDNGFYVLLEASRNGNVECVKLLLERARKDFSSSQEIFKLIKQNLHPFEVAIEADHWEVVDELFPLYSENCPAEITNAVSEVSGRENKKCLEVIANRDPHFLDELDDEDLRPIHKAVLCRHLKAVKNLVHFGADINATTRYDGLSALHILCTRSQFDMDILKFLLDTRVDPNIRNDKSETPLHYAAAYGLADVIELLLTYGANPGNVDTCEFVPLLAAIKKSNFDCVKALATVTPRKFHASAIVHAAMERNCECLRYLFETGFESFSSIDSDEFAGWEKVLFLSPGWGPGEDERISSVTRILIANGTKFNDVAMSTVYYIPMLLVEPAFCTLKAFCDFGLIEILINSTLPHVEGTDRCIYKVFVYNLLHALGVYRNIIRDFRTSLGDPLYKISILLRYFPYAVLHVNTNPSENCKVLPAVPTLLSVCRWSIRSRLAERYEAILERHVTMLSLPNLLKRYLLHQ